jgi:succinoglycan biosynthesis protein ExoH
VASMRMMSRKFRNRLDEELGRVVGSHLRNVPQAHLSTTIQLARIALIVGLVFLHYGMYPNVRWSPFLGASVDEHEVATFVNSYLLFFFFSAVPLLSAISGWLFFAFAGEDGADALQSMGARIRKRIGTLYVPLLLWNLLYVIVLATLFALEPAHPVLSALNIDFQTASWWRWLNAVFAIDHYPVAFQFWFVRDLFVTVLVSPLLWLLLRHLPYVGAAMLFIGWLLDFKFGIFFRPDVLFFFYLGALVRIKKLRVGLTSKDTLIILAIYLVAVGIRTAALYVVDEHSLLLGAVTRSMRLLGALACWGVFLRVAGFRWGQKLASLGGLAFFLYATHFPLIAEIKLLLWRLLPEINDTWMLAHYLASVVLTVLICLGGGMVLARVLPGVFALLNGGRAWPGRRTSSLSA